MPEEGMYNRAFRDVAGRIGCASATCCGRGGRANSYYSRVLRCTVRTQSAAGGNEVKQRSVERGDGVKYELQRVGLDAHATRRVEADSIRTTVRFISQYMYYAYKGKALMNASPRYMSVKSFAAAHPSLRSRCAPPPSPLSRSPPVIAPASIN